MPEGGMASDAGGGWQLQFSFNGATHLILLHIISNNIAMDVQYHQLLVKFCCQLIVVKRLAKLLPHVTISLALLPARVSAPSSRRHRDVYQKPISELLLLVASRDA